MKQRQLWSDQPKIQLWLAKPGGRYAQEESTGTPVGERYPAQAIHNETMRKVPHKRSKPNSETTQLDN
jgi:hypothetical protein